jgi:hypothetical protein
LTTDNSKRKENNIMKANLKKMLGLAALGMTLLTTTVPTWAGQVVNQQVQITYGTNNTFVATGALTTARYSADSRQYIGCRVSAYANGSRSATCAAQTSTDNLAYCSTSDPKLIEKIQTMTDSSYVHFRGNRTTAACSVISIYNYSTRLR